ncbi:MAG: replication-associated recombination protein A [Hyphomicrobiales bacterium]
MIHNNIPLAEQLRPTNINDYIGQTHLLGEGAILRKIIESGRIPSIILWGPPGVGKTTIAQIIAKSQNMPFFTLSAINSGVKDVRSVIDKAKNNLQTCILFIDEIHRFSKSQQDSLLGAVEKGIITLIGATTENPSFEVISPLLSRCQVFVLKSMSKDELSQLILKGKQKLEEIYKKEIQIQESDALLSISGGDGRKLYNALEVVVSNLTEQETITITNANVKSIIQQNLSMYDKGGEMHYDVISAFIKSIRGSDPNAAVYWLSRMVAAGEDPKFIARRLLISAAEDIGLANPNALLLANTCFDAVQKIGWPESRIILSQTTIYLATSPKSNSAYMAINKGQSLVKQTGDLPVPLHLRNAPTQLMKDLEYGKEYKYAHDYPNNFVQQEYLPDSISRASIYETGDNKREEGQKTYLNNLWKSKYKF